jgi:hypothetical protein
MDVFIFNSLSPWNVRALSLEAAGDRLPVEYAPWQLLPHRTLLSGDLPGAVSRALLRDGFFLTSTITHEVDRPNTPVEKRRKVPVSSSAPGPRKPRPYPLSFSAINTTHTAGEFSVGLPRRQSSKIRSKELARIELGDPCANVKAC